jgi:ribosomal protein S14
MNHINRDKNRRKLFAKYEMDKKNYKFILTQPHVDEKTKEIAQIKLQNLPRASSLVRIRNRCIITGRPRGVYKNYRLSRIIFREYAQIGLLPGIRKSSW